ncbi:MAG: phosphoribosylaminoimidazolesuccinocarboxamide synthase [Candidatus Aminicenantes bacterium]|nr:phosphoribosylaminoimidazolesuccinocarboxamide synthase [Candidatus Aminicenantes bacterium]
MGSVKDLIVLEKPTPERSGRGRFIFSDRYSVFDWGEMPDHIAQKGQALCLLGAYFFEKLEKLGVPTHYYGLVANDQPAKLDEINQPAGVMEVKLVRVLEPTPTARGYDYSLYQTEKANFLIPLEVIYRNSLPPGSSVFKRLREGKLKPSDIGLDHFPEPGEKLAQPILDVSTKLEASDRYLSWEEAQQIAGLSDKEVERIQETVLLVNRLITEEVERLGLSHEDGKVEFAFDEERSLILVDVLGTPDECRFTFDGIPVSKEAARIYYRRTPWFKEVEAAKKQDAQRWKELVKSSPPPLSPRMKKLVEGLYQACCNEITGRQWFSVPPLRQIITELRQELEL